MFQAGSDHSRRADIVAPATVKSGTKSNRFDSSASEEIADAAALADRARPRRRTPRQSIIVVLPEDHVVSSHRLERLRDGLDHDVDVLVACAGQPTNLNALQRSVGHAQFLLAPAGTSIEGLRELAIREVSGDIVRLVSGARADDSEGTETELSMTS